jgi:hypothetical protein
MTQAESFYGHVEQLSNIARRWRRDPNTGRLDNRCVVERRLATIAMNG